MKQPLVVCVNEAGSCYDRIVQSYIGCMHNGNNGGGKIIKDVGRGSNDRHDNGHSNGDGNGYGSYVTKNDGGGAGDSGKQVRPFVQ